MERGALVVSAFRMALHVAGASMLGYALRVYFAGIHWRLPENRYRWLIPALFTAALLLFLRAAVREFRNVRKGIGR